MAVATTIDETLSGVISPNYGQDQTFFMLTRSSHLQIVSIKKDEVVTVTRTPNQAGATATVEIIPHQDNPPEERMQIGSRSWGTGTGPTLVLDDTKPFVSFKVLPVLEQPGVPELLELVSATRPWYMEQYLEIERKPRQALIYVLDGSVIVTRQKVTQEVDSGGISVDGDDNDWSEIEPLVTGPIEGLKALYVTNDSDFIYFMLESDVENTGSGYDINLDLDNDGAEDHSIHINSPDDPQGKPPGLFNISGGKKEFERTSEFFASGKVVELRFPLEDISGGGFAVTGINIAFLDGSRYVPGSNGWKGYVKANITPPPSSTGSNNLPSIPFPSTESLWKTTDGGHTWERILTSGLNITVSNREMRVGHLASVALSVDFAQDNTLFVYESSGKVWVSTNGGTTFTPYK